MPQRGCVAMGELVSAKQPLLTFLPVLQPRGILAKSVFIFCTMLLTQYCPLCHRIWLSQWHWGRTRMSLDRLQETDSAAAICVQTVAILSYIFKYPQKILEPTFFLIILCKKKVTSIYWFPLLMFEMNVWFLERDEFWSRRCLDRHGTAQPQRKVVMLDATLRLKWQGHQEGRSL